MHPITPPATPQHSPPQVADFGLSRILTPSAMACLTGETGSYLWMSPECIRHEVLHLPLPACQPAGLWASVLLPSARAFQLACLPCLRCRGWWCRGA